MAVDVMEVVKMIREGDKIGVQIYLRNGGDPNARTQMCWTLLHMACFEGQKDIAEVLIEGGASVNSCTTDMSTPLHRACAQGNKSVVEILVNKGAYLNAQDKNGNTALHEAARGFHTSIVKVLIEKKADGKKQNKKQQTFLNMVGQQLMPYVESGDSEILQMWLDWGLSPDTKGNLHWSILHHACARGQLNIASLLISRGADVNIEDSNKTTPLHTSCFHGNERIAKLICESGANLNLQDQRGNTPLHSAISGGHPEVINLLLDRGCDTTIPNKEGQYFTHLYYLRRVNEFLVTAVQGSKIGHVVSLLKGRADPDTRCPEGYTVLCHSAFKGDVLIVDALLEAGANPNLTDISQGKTPLHYASSWGYLFVVKSLLDKGASVTIQDKNGVTALHEAAREGCEDVITVLCGRGAPVNGKDKDGNTPLHIAGKWGKTSAVEILVESNAEEDIRNNNHLLYSDLALIRAVRTADKDQVISGMAWGGDPNSRDHRGWTLLHHAVYKGEKEICEVVLECGANPNATDNHNRTPLILAAYRGNHQIMEILLDAEADTDCKDWMGRTALHWAATEGSVETVQLLLENDADTTIRSKDGRLYSDLLLKHLYLAVRHEDADKVVRYVNAGADQFAEVEGTGLTPRDEAKRRGLFKILQQMASMAMKKPKPEDINVALALEDVFRLYEDGAFIPVEDQEACEKEEPVEEEEAEAAEVQEMEAHPKIVEDDNEEDAYWKMSNACEVVSVNEAFKKDHDEWLSEFEEKPKVISAKELLAEEQEAFWESIQEKQKAISAKEFFKEETDWWLNDDDKEDERDEEDHIHIGSPEIIHNEVDECWWRDAQENLNSSNQNQDEKPWWENEENDSDNEEQNGSPMSEARRWWQHEVKKTNIISVESLIEDEKPWWQKDKVPAKEFFEDDKPWWEEDDDDDNLKVVSSKELSKQENESWWDSKDKETKVSAKDYFKEEAEEAWWLDEVEEQQEKPEGLKKSSNSVRFSEKYTQNIEYENGYSDDEIDELTRTEDYEDANSSIISNSSTTMYSASEGTPFDISWNEDFKTPPRAKDFFKEKHWLDDNSEGSDPTEVCGIDTSDISEIITANELSYSECWNQSTDPVNSDAGLEVSDIESELGDEMEELEEEEEAEEEIEEEYEDEEGELETEEGGSIESEGEEELEEETEDELKEPYHSEKEEVITSDKNDIYNEHNRVDDSESKFISDDQISNVNNIDVPLVENNSNVIITDLSKVKEVQKLSVNPSIVLHKIDDAINEMLSDSLNEKQDNKYLEDTPSLELINKVVSKSYAAVEQEPSNVDIDITNTNPLININPCFPSDHELERELQKSDSQTSGCDSSLSLSDNRVKDLSKDSGFEGLSIDECIEDTDISDMTNTVSAEAMESLEESISQNECECLETSVQGIQLIAKEFEEVCKQEMDDCNDKHQLTDKENENEQVIIQMKWDNTENECNSTLTESNSPNSCSPNTDSQTEAESGDKNQTIPETDCPESVEPETKDNKTNNGDQNITKVENTSEQPMSKSYASAVKTNLEKHPINKMDDCFAKLDASLAWVDAKLTKESAERMYNENVQEHLNGNSKSSFSKALKNESKHSLVISEQSETKKPKEDSSEMKDKEKTHFLRIHVRVPDEEIFKDVENKTERKLSIEEPISLSLENLPDSRHENSEISSQLETVLNKNENENSADIEKQKEISVVGNNFYAQSESDNQSMRTDVKTQLLNDVHHNVINEFKENENDTTELVDKKDVSNPLHIINMVNLGCESTKDLDTIVPMQENNQTDVGNQNTQDHNSKNVENSHIELSSNQEVKNVNLKSEEIQNHELTANTNLEQENIKESITLKELDKTKEQANKKLDKSEESNFSKEKTNDELRKTENSLCEELCSKDAESQCKQDKRKEPSNKILPEQSQFIYNNEENIPYSVNHNEHESKFIENSEILPDHKGDTIHKITKNTDSSIDSPPTKLSSNICDRVEAEDPPTEIISPQRTEENVILVEDSNDRVSPLITEDNVIPMEGPKDRVSPMRTEENLIPVKYPNDSVSPLRTEENVLQMEDPKDRVAPHKIESEIISRKDSIENTSDTSCNGVVSEDALDKMPPDKEKCENELCTKTIDKKPQSRESSVEKISKESIGKSQRKFDEIISRESSAEKDIQQKTDNKINSREGSGERTSPKRTDDEIVSRESSVERISPHRESRSPSLTDRTIWRCSTYDAMGMSLSDYDNLSFMIQKSFSTSTCGKNKSKKKEHYDSISSLEEAKDILKNETFTSPINKDEKEGSPLVKNKSDKENITLKGEGNNPLYSGRESDNGNNSNENISVSKVASNDSEEKVLFQNVPDVSSVPIPERTQIVEDEACTNLRSSSIQDPPVAPRRNKGPSLSFEKVKYTVADDSADKKTSHANEQSTNTPLYDPDERKTTKIVEAVSEMPDEQKVQQQGSSTKKSKRDKEKQKELMANDKVDPVRKSSSCSVS